jgi:hypothetical protein
LLGQRHRAVDQPAIQVVRDQPLAERHQHPLGERRRGAPEIPEHQLPPPVQPRRHHGFRVADLVIRLEQHHHGQQRRRHGSCPPRLVDRGQLGLERLVEQLVANRSEEDVELANAMQGLGNGSFVGRQRTRDRPANRCGHAPIRSQDDRRVDPLGAII